MRFSFVLIFLLAAQVAVAQDWEERKQFGPNEALTKLRIISSTDTSFFAQFIEKYLASRPTVSIDYMVTGTAELDRIFRSDPGSYDLVISSAMDLQFKLANDGYAHRFESISLPHWSKWRDSLFAFTSEPATIVVNKEAFSGRQIPKTRQELINALRERPEVFRDRVGTYDVRSSGLGYLFATQDARTSDTYWRLMEVIGRLNAKLYCCSGDMIDDLLRGEILVAYNVLGSYAAARTDTHEVLEIVLPSDYPTTMMRTAMVSNASKQKDDAVAFIRHLTSGRSNPTEGMLPPLMSDQNSVEQITITLEPALMTYLDQLKRRTFISEWESAVIQKQ